MAGRGLSLLLGSLLTMLVAGLLAVHAYVELTDPAVATDAFSAGIAGVVQDNESLQQQYEDLQALAAQAPGETFQVPGLGITLTSAQLQELSFEEASRTAAGPIANVLYSSGASAAQEYVQSIDAAGNPDLQRAQGTIVENLDSAEFGFGIVSDGSHDLAATARSFLLIAVLVCAGLLFLVSSGPRRLSGPGLATLTAAIPYLVIFFFASQWFGPQEEAGLTENVRESLAPTVDSLFNTYLYVALAAGLTLFGSLVWRIFLSTGQFGLEAPPPRRASYEEPAEYRPAPRPRPSRYEPAYEPEPFFPPEPPPAHEPPPERRRPPPWSGARPTPAPGPGLPDPPPGSSTGRRNPFDGVLSDDRDR
ncbi:MAG: hypothetical protein GEU28_11165 [Dehalococcoidia bacterium]|nr:hypothetical protein [Dehalococcoidia bacterium]